MRTEVDIWPYFLATADAKGVDNISTDMATASLFACNATIRYRTVA